MEVRELLFLGIRKLRESGCTDTPKTDAELLLADLLDTQRPLLYISHEEVSTDVIKKYLEYIERRINGEPVSYILGYKYFYGEKFLVSRDVLIPRYETELLVDAVLKLKPFARNILDIGTGSGCIGITLKKYLKNKLSVVVMTDISQKALEIAKENAIRILGERKTQKFLVFIRANMLEDLRESLGAGKFDVIVSNPPYVEEEYLKNMKTMEPFDALYGGIDGTKYYVKIANRVKDFLKPEGIVALEVGGEKQAEKIKNIFRLKGFRNFITYKDLNGIVRVVIARRY